MKGWRLWVPQPEAPARVPVVGEGAAGGVPEDVVWAMAWAVAGVWVVALGAEVVAASVMARVADRSLDWSGHSSQVPRGCPPA